MTELSSTAPRRPTGPPSSSLCGRPGAATGRREAWSCSRRTVRQRLWRRSRSLRRPCTCAATRPLARAPRVHYSTAGMVEKSSLLGCRLNLLELPVNQEQTHAKLIHKFTAKSYLSLLCFAPSLAAHKRFATHFLPCTVGNLQL